MSVMCSNAKSEHGYAILCSSQWIFFPHIRVLSPNKMQWRWVILSHLAGRELMEAVSAVKMAQQRDLSILLKIKRVVITGFQT